jgi:hypothetical protein
VAVDRDGSGAASFAPLGAPIEKPDGIAVDAAARRIYWINVVSHSISWANLDGASAVRSIHRAHM